MLLKKILIISESGVPLFQYSLDQEDFDSTLVSGLITAMLGFAKETVRESISQIFFEESLYLFAWKEQILCAVQVSLDLQPEYIRFIIGKILDQFLEMFRDHVKVLESRVSAFKDFESKCVEILQQCGLELVEALYNTDNKSVVAFSIHSAENELLFVNVKTPEYLSDAFDIYAVLAKNTNKVKHHLLGVNKLALSLLTDKGNMIQILSLPLITCVIHYVGDGFSSTQVRKMRILTSTKLVSSIETLFPGAAIEIFGRRMKYMDPNKETPKFYLFLNDYYKGAQEGINALFDDRVRTMLLIYPENTLVFCKLPTRTIVFKQKQELETPIVVENIHKLYSVTR